MIDLIPGDQLSQDLLAETLALMIQYLAEIEDESVEFDEESPEDLVIYQQTTKRELAV